MTELPADVDARLGRITFWLVLMRDTDLQRDDPALMEEHLRWQLRLEDERRLLAAGPLNWGEAERGPGGAVGMYVLAVASRDEAEEIAAREPFERLGRREHTIYSWMLNEGVAVPLAREIAR